jgi:hypothetical protein
MKNTNYEAAQYEYVFFHFMLFPLRERPSLTHVRETIECSYLYLYYLFIYLFIDAIGSSACIALNNRTISKLERKWKEAVVV